MRSRRDGAHDSEQTEPPRDVLPVVLEACRRYDEYRKARALVPDEAALKPTGSKPTRTVEESDIGFLRTLWTRITSGATPEDCERAIAADSYRVRSLLAHWLETGALAVPPRRGCRPAPGYFWARGPGPQPRLATMQWTAAPPRIVAGLRFPRRVRLRLPMRRCTAGANWAADRGGLGVVPKGAVAFADTSLHIESELDS